MEQRKINASGLAREIEVSHVAILNFLGGQLPKSEHLLALSKYFEVTMEEMLYGPRSEWTVEQESRRAVALVGDARPFRLLERDQTMVSEYSRLASLADELKSGLDRLALGFSPAPIPAPVPEQNVNYQRRSSKADAAAARAAEKARAALPTQLSATGATSGKVSAPSPSDPKSRGPQQ